MKNLIAIVFTLLLASCAMTTAETVWIDVRTEAEFNKEHISGATLIPYDTIATEIEKVYPDKDQEILLYCRSGRRSGIALQALKDLGYTNAKNAGGLKDAQELFKQKRLAD